MMSLIACFLILINFLECVVCFPSGATVDACDALLPRHVNSKSNLGPSPYHVIASGDTYDSADIFSHKHKSIKVDISGQPFKGFIVTAVDPHTGKRVGNFSTVKGTSNLPCAAITHTDNRLKKYASLLWLPPKDEKGFVTFVATIVRSFENYYPGILATVVQKPHYSTDHYQDLNMEHIIPDPLIRK